jgi:hypothetical protein
MASTSAMAEYTKSGSGSSNQGKVEACQVAKATVANLLSNNEQVESYSACSCEQQANIYGGQNYTCSVDAKVGKK